MTICCRVIFLEVTEIKLEPSPKRSHSMIKVQFSDGHLRPFHTESLPPPSPSLPQDHDVLTGHVIVAIMPVQFNDATHLL